MVERDGQRVRLSMRPVRAVVRSEAMVGDRGARWLARSVKRFMGMPILARPVEQSMA